MLKNVNKFLTLKNVKQAAYVAPEQTPQTPVVPEPEVETVTVNVEVYAGVATQTVSAADVATKLGVEDLAAAIADGSVTYVGLNADGTVYTVTDEEGKTSTPASTTQGVAGHWYSTEFNPMVWGTEGLTLFAYLEGDGASYTLGYADANAFVEGETYKLAGKYIYGDAEVVFEVVMTGVAAPEVPDFVAPEADDEFNVEVIEGKTGSYEYLTAEKEVEILAALGLDGDYDYEGALKDAKDEGALTIMGYNPDGTMADLQGTTDGWMKADGSMITWGTDGFAVCIKPWEEPLGIYINMVAGDEAVGYFAFVAGDSKYVVKANVAVVLPEIDETVYEVQDTYEVAFETSFANGYQGGTHTIDAGICADMATAIGLADLAEATRVMLNTDETVAGNGDPLGGTNGWYGVDGPASWGNGSIAFFNKDRISNVADWAYGCHPDIAKEGDVVTVKVEFRNPATAKSVRYYATITVVE